MKPIHLFFLLSTLCFGCTSQMEERATLLNNELAEMPIFTDSFDSIMEEVRTLPFKQRIQVTFNAASRDEETRDGLIKQEQLLLELLSLESTKERKKILLQLIETYRHQDKANIPGAIDKGVNRCNELLNNYSLTKEEQWEIQKKQALLLNEQGKQNEYLPIWYQLLDEHRVAKRPELIIEDYAIIASHFIKLDERRQSISLYKEAYILAKEKQLSELQKQCFTELITLLYDAGHYREILDSCSRITIDTITTYPSSVHSIQSKCYLQLHQPDSARYYLNKMFEATNQEGKMGFYCRMAETYIAEEQEDSATIFLDKAVAQYREQTGYNKDLLLPNMFLPVYASYGSLLHHNGKSQKAQEIFSSIEPLMKEQTKETVKIEKQMDALTRYSALCRTQGKIREALDLLVYKDSIREVYDTIREEQDSRNQIAIFQSNEQIYENRIQKQELDNSERINSFYLFGVTVFVILLGGSIWINERQKSKIKQLLKENASLKKTVPQTKPKEKVPKATPKEKKKKEETTYIPPKVKELFAKAEQEIIEQKLFTNKKLKLEDVAKVLGVSSSKLSECINANGVNFNDWINKFRIRYIVERLDSTSQNGMLYEEAGFSSRSAFYASFKKEMGCSPTKYLKKRDS
ncbi:helix-turn-helix domain-containing protein [Bacteroides sp.]